MVNRLLGVKNVQHDFHTKLLEHFKNSFPVPNEPPSGRRLADVVTLTIDLEVVVGTHFAVATLAFFSKGELAFFSPGELVTGRNLSENCTGKDDYPAHP